MSTIRRWRQDAAGYYLDMALGEKAGFGVECTDFLPIGASIASGIWTAAAGVTVSDTQVSGTISKAVLQATAAGTIACTWTLTYTAGGVTQIKPVPFRVVVK